MISPKLFPLRFIHFTHSRVCVCVWRIFFTEDTHDGKYSTSGCLCATCVRVLKIAVQVYHFDRSYRGTSVLSHELVYFRPGSPAKPNFWTSKTSKIQNISNCLNRATSYEHLFNNLTFEFWFFFFNFNAKMRFRTAVWCFSLFSTLFVYNVRRFSPDLGRLKLDGSLCKCPPVSHVEQSQLVRRITTADSPLSDSAVAPASRANRLPQTHADTE